MINNQIAKSLACAVWLDKSPTISNKHSVGEHIFLTDNNQSHKVLKCLGNHLVVENVVTKEQSIVHTKDTIAVATRFWGGRAC